MGYFRCSIQSGLNPLVLPKERTRELWAKIHAISPHQPLTSSKPERPPLSSHPTTTNPPPQTKKRQALWPWRWALTGSYLETRSIGKSSPNKAHIKTFSLIKVERGWVGRTCCGRGTYSDEIDERLLTASLISLGEVEMFWLKHHYVDGEMLTGLSERCCSTSVSPERAKGMRCPPFCQLFIGRNKMNIVDLVKVTHSDLQTEVNGTLLPSAVSSVPT